jgi:hypothetical protein
MLGATYSSFGDDKSAGATFNTGNRLVFQGGYSTTVRSVGYSLSGWNLTRTQGTRADGRDAPSENITNIALGLSFALGGVSLEPTVEARHLARAAVTGGTTPGEASGTGQMETLGLRSRWNAGGLQFVPSASYSIGTLEGMDLSGWRGTLAIRFAR